MPSSLANESRLSACCAYITGPLRLPCKDKRQHLLTLQVSRYNLGSTHSGCLYWDIEPLVLVSYSNRANEKHSLMLV